MPAHQASCQCGQLRATAKDDPDVVVVCNCKACQKRTGSPFGEAGYFKKELVEISGDYEQWSRTAESGRALTNCFCPHCGTNVFWTLEMRPDHIGIAAGCMETKLPEPLRAIWTESKHDWVEFPEHWPTFEKAAPLG